MPFWCLRQRTRSLQTDYEILTKMNAKKKQHLISLGILLPFRCLSVFFMGPLNSVVKSLHSWPVTLHHTSSWSFLAGQRDGEAICLALPGRLTSTQRRSLAQGLCRGRCCQSDSSRLCLAIRLAATSVVVFHPATTNDARVTFCS